MSIGCIILHYRNLDDTVACLSSLNVKESARRDWKTFLVNNSPEDGFGKALEEAARATGAPYEIIAPGSNTGFARGCNLGACRAIEQGYTHILLLNNDTLAAPDFVEQAFRAVDKTPDAVIAGLVTDVAGNPTHNIGTLSPWTGRVRHIFNAGHEGDVSFVSGCLMLVPAQLLKLVGLFDERLFMYCEDTDFCIRLRKAGGKIRYRSSLRVQHKFDPASSRSGFPKEYYIQRNQAFIVSRNGTLIQRATLFLFLAALPLYRLFVRRALWNQSVQGAWDGLRGRMGILDPGRKFQGGGG